MLPFVRNTCHPSQIYSAGDDITILLRDKKRVNVIYEFISISRPPNCFIDSTYAISSNPPEGPVYTQFCVQIGV
jgi:hypothetical protein